MKTLLVLLLAYLLGAIPVAYILVKLLYGRDIRQMGTRTVCAMNVAESMSFGLGILTAALDILKAILVMLLAKYWVGTNFLMVLAPVLVVAGDTWSPFLGFNGGKGLAAIIGILFVLKWSAAFWLILLFFVAMFFLREPNLVINISLTALPFITWWQFGSFAGFLLGLAMLLPVLAKFISLPRDLLPPNILSHRF